MPNAVKSPSTLIPALAKTSNITSGYILLAPDGGIGPTSVTGWYNGITPQPGKYIVYYNTFSGPLIYTPQSDAELIRLANSFGFSVSTAAEALNVFSLNAGYFVANKAYPNIITENLVYLIDSTFTTSYPGSGLNTVPLRDPASVGNGTLQNGVGFNSDALSFIFDGSDDQIPINNSNNFANIDWSTGFTLMVLYKIDAVTDFNGQFRCMIGVTGGGRSWNYYLYGPSNPATTLLYHFSGQMSSGLSSAVTVTPEDYHLGVFTIAPGTGVGTYYHDGVVVSTQAAASSPSYTTSGGTQYLGRGDNMWKGNIAKWMIYNKALTQAEILQNYYQGNIVTSNLSLAIDAGNLLDTSTSTTIKDISGNGNTFTYEGTVTRSLDYGGTLRLNTGRIYRDSLGWYGNYTISFWVKFEDLNFSGYFYTENFRGSGGCARIYSGINSNGTFSYNVWDNSSIGTFGTGNFITTTTTNVRDGNWHQITCIWSNGNSNRTRGIYIYCDGVQEGYTDMIGNDGSYASMHLGGSFGCVGEYASNSYLGPILQYNNVALSDAQVKQNYSAHASSFK
jgi:hypothetical protein